MSFEQYEESKAGGSRVELYTLTIGSTIYRMHNSVEASINSGGNTFYRTQVSRGSIQTGQEFLEISLPGDHDFPLTFTTIAPGQTATLTIQTYQRSDTADVRVIYKGVVRAVAFQHDASKSAISLVPVNEAFDKPIPERTFQAMCNHVLFDSECKVSAGLHVYDGAIIAVNGNIVTVGGLETAKGDGWSTGGYCRYGVLDYRLILEQDGNDLILVLPFHEDVLSETISVYAGCDHSIATCQSKFGAEIDYGGCPYVPTKNIFVTGIK